MTAKIPLALLAALTLACGAAPTPSDPCAEGRCGAEPMAPAEHQDQPRSVEGGRELQTLRCPLVNSKNPQVPRHQCRVRLGPMRFAVTEGPNGVVVTLLNTGAQPHQTPLRLPVEGPHALGDQR